MGKLADEMTRMGKLTEEMTRLCHEIKSGHNSRKELAKYLDWFTSNLKQNVLEKLAAFHKEHSEMAQKTNETAQKIKAERLMFIRNLKETVLDLRQDTNQWRKAFASDLEGARRTWRDPQDE